MMRCHRCREAMTVYVVGDDYCATCRRELNEIARKDEARRAAPNGPTWRRRLTAKEMPLGAA